LAPVAEAILFALGSSGPSAPLLIHAASVALKVIPVVRNPLAKLRSLKGSLVRVQTAAVITFVSAADDSRISVRVALTARCW